MTLHGVSVDPVVRIREAVHERLGEQGWSILDNHPISLPHRRVSAIPLQDGWFATLLVDDWLEDDEHETPINFAAGFLGLDYEPARRITIALTSTPRSGVVVKDPSLSIALPDATEADAPVASLVRFATEHLDSLSKLADVDTVRHTVQPAREGDALPHPAHLRQLLPAGRHLARHYRVLVRNEHPDDLAHVRPHDRRYEGAPRLSSRASIRKLSPSRRNFGSG